MTSNLKHAAKRDTNEKEIVDYLRIIGCSVDRVGGKGTPDLLVGYKGCNLLMEVKMPGKKLNPTQVDWHDRWKGQADVVRDIADVNELLSWY